MSSRIAAAIVILVGAVAPLKAQLLKARFFQEHVPAIPADAKAPPPSGLRDWPVEPMGVIVGDPRDFPPGPDVFIADGAETALAVNVSNPDNLVGLLNLGFTTSPSMRVSSNANVTWSTRAFPTGSGGYTGFPFDPWAAPGNADDELYGLLIRRDQLSSNTHCVIGRSTDAGQTWTRYFERTLDVFQDRAMMDVDRARRHGGGPGMAHNGKIYLCYDNFGVNGSGYTGSYVQVVSRTGAALNEVTISTGANFRGSQIQPVAGVEDGQVYLMSLSTSGSQAFLRFHELTEAGAGVALDKSSIAFFRTGQQLGASGRFGVNGHRINTQMTMGIDRTDGPRRGWLYVASNRNPNPFNSNRDQGDVYISVSMDGGLTWQSAELPGVRQNRTQFFSTIDVDDNGWIHFAYYQNRTGSMNNGVLNASEATVHYTVSRDGGETWTRPIRVNSAENVLFYFDPPPNLAQQNYYLIGDYWQIKATGLGADTRVYALWTGYDKDRSDLFLNDKRERVLCTLLTSLPFPGDLNCDGAIDAFDIEWFILALVDPAGYALLLPDCDVNNADINGDGAIDAFDIEAFVALLVGP